MTILIPSCERVTALLTEYEEGALGPLDWLGVKLHLTLCPPCQALLRAFEQVPILLRRFQDPPDDAAPPPSAEQALGAVLAALREGRVPTGPQHHPESEAWRALEPGGDPFLSLLLRLHLGHCQACREVRGEGLAIRPGGHPLDTLRPHLPPESQWRWARRGLGGGRVAVVHRDARTGASLNLACLPGGRSVPVHDHDGLECALLLRGSLQDGPAHLRPGDWMSHRPGHQHGPKADPGDECWALVALERPVRFTGWRRALGLFTS